MFPLRGKDKGESQVRYVPVPLDHGRADGALAPQQFVGSEKRPERVASEGKLLLSTTC